MKHKSIGWFLSLGLAVAVAGAEDHVVPVAPVAAAPVAPAPVAPAPVAPVPAGNATFWHDGGLDHNGDGLISDEELAAALAKRCATLRQTLAGEAPAFVRHYDLNGDGKLDPKEIDAACAKLEEKFRVMAKELNQAAIHRFDKNGDGQLDEAEKAELKKGVALISKRTVQARPEAARAGGVHVGAPVSASARPVPEEIALRGEELRRERAAASRDQLQKFDLDGDGKLNAEEKAKARAAVLGKISDP